MTYFVSPPNPATWELAPEEFTARLRARWPDVTVEPVTHSRSHYALDFEMTVAGHAVRGSLWRNGQVVTTDGEVVACAELAVWFRGQVPAEHDLLFYDESYTAAVPLDDVTDAATAAQPFL